MRRFIIHSEFENCFEVNEINPVGRQEKTLHFSLRNTATHCRSKLSLCKRLSIITQNITLKGRKPELK